MHSGAGACSPCGRQWRVRNISRAGDRVHTVRLCSPMHATAVHVHVPAFLDEREGCCHACSGLQGIKILHVTRWEQRELGQ